MKYLNLLRRIAVAAFMSVSLAFLASSILEKVALISVMTVYLVCDSLASEKGNK